MATCDNFDYGCRALISHALTRGRSAAHGSRCSSSDQQNPGGYACVVRRFRPKVVGLYGVALRNCSPSTVALPSIPGQGLFKVKLPVRG
jgi:hypothetical protein